MELLCSYVHYANKAPLLILTAFLMLHQSSIINYLARCSVATGRPRVVVTTHFLVLRSTPCFVATNANAFVQDIFRKKLLEPSLLIDQSPSKNEEMQSVISSDTGRVVCTVMASTDAPESYSAASNSVPLFELRRGVSNHSNALACAAKCGKCIRPSLQ